MRNIIDPQYRSILKILEESQSCLIFDFDKALVPIGEHHRNAFVILSTLRLLREVSKLYPCAIFSGRKRKDVIDRLVGVSIPCIVGNHGFEWNPPDLELEKFQSQIQTWFPIFLKLFRPIHGVEIENRGLSIAVHYGKASDRREAMLAMSQAMHEVETAQMVQGIEVVSFLPQEIELRKEEVLKRICSTLKTKGGIYLGDEAFGDSNIVGIHIGDPKTNTDFFIDKQEKIDDFLSIMLSMRRTFPSIYKFAI